MEHRSFSLVFSVFFNVLWNENVFFSSKNEKRKDLLFFVFFLVFFFVWTGPYKHEESAIAVH